MRRKYLTFLALTTIVLSLVFLYQFKSAGADDFGSIADGDQYQINYSLKKVSQGEWMIDIEVFLKNGEDIVIEESLITFAEPVSEEIHSKGNDLINHYFEGHVLHGTKLFSEVKMKEILKDSFIDIKWKTQDNIEKAERIKF